MIFEALGDKRRRLSEATHVSYVPLSVLDGGGYMYVLLMVVKKVPPSWMARSRGRCKLE